jgi:hypothetical protein
MERRVNKRVDTYMMNFKENIKEKMEMLGVKNDILLQYIYDYDRIEFTQDDFMKRKRVKNVVPIFDRCCAKRANSEQCTRRKRVEEEYCGTHMKGIPHGIIDNKEDTKETTYKVEVWAQDIQGIIYYIDKTGNVYQAEDIVNNIVNPKIIAKYNKNGDHYSIPDFGLM